RSTRALPQAATITSTVVAPSLSVPTQSPGTTAVVKEKPPPLLDVVTTVPSHEIGANLAAWPPETVTMPPDSAAVLTVSAAASAASNAISSAAPMVSPTQRLNPVDMSLSFKLAMLDNAMGPTDPALHLHQPITGWRWTP